MTPEVRNIVLCILAVLLLIICIKRGFANGFVVELRKLIGVTVALLCIVLLVALRGAFADKAYGVAVIIAGGIVILSLGWKAVRMVIGLLSGLAELPIIEWLDSLLGACIGAAECAMIVWGIMQVYNALTIA